MSVCSKRRNRVPAIAVGLSHATTGAAIVAALAGVSRASADYLPGNYSVVNTTGSTQEYSVSFTGTLSVPLSQALAGGSLAGSVTDLGGDGAQLSAVSSSAIYTALVDGVEIAELLSAPFSVSADAFGSASIGPVSFGAPIPSQPVGPVNNNYQINLNFLLSSGDAASFTSDFVLTAVPAPGALALAGAASAIGRRRRRRNTLAAAGVATLGLAAAAPADGPQVQVQLQVDSASNPMLPVGVATGAPGTFQYTGSSNLAADHSFSFSVIGTELSTAGRALLGGSLNYSNISSQTQFVTMAFELPALNNSATSLIGGSFSGSFTANGDGGFLALGSPAQLSLWEAAIGDGTIGLLNGWSGITVAPNASVSLGSHSFGLPGPSMVGPGSFTSTKIQLSFRISAGDSTSFSTVFVAQPVPAPGALALIAVGICALPRRRR